MSFEWPGRPAQHFSEGKGRAGSSAFASRSRSASGRKRARHRQNFFAKFVSKGLASKIDICMCGVSHSGQPFASHVLEKLDSELQQQKGAFFGSRGVRVLISSFSPHGAKGYAELKRALAARCMATMTLADGLFALGLPSNIANCMCPFDDRYQRL